MTAIRVAESLDLAISRLTNLVGSTANHNPLARSPQRQETSVDADRAELAHEQCVDA
jgi:hypothetical protein